MALLWGIAIDAITSFGIYLGCCAILATTEGVLYGYMCKLTGHSESFIRRLWC